jgi:hypothetical protein
MGPVHAGAAAGPGGVVLGPAAAGCSLGVVASLLRDSRYSAIPEPTSSRPGVVPGLAGAGRGGAGWVGVSCRPMRWCRRRSGAGAHQFHPAGDRPETRHLPAHPTHPSEPERKRGQPDRRAGQEERDRRSGRHQPGRGQPPGEEMSVHQRPACGACPAATVPTAISSPGTARASWRCRAAHPEQQQRPQIRWPSRNATRWPGGKKAQN